MVWYFQLLKNFPQFVVIHTIKGFGIVNKAEVDVFLELSLSFFFFFFFDDPMYVDNLISGSAALTIQLEHLKVHGSCTAQAWLGEF